MTRTYLIVLEQCIPLFGLDLLANFVIRQVDSVIQIAEPEQMAANQRRSIRQRFAHGVQRGVTAALTRSLTHTHDQRWWRPLRQSLLHQRLLVDKPGPVFDSTQQAAVAGT
jgi:hypothetical protein